MGAAAFLSSSPVISPRPPRVVIAEDQPEMRLLISRALRAEGYEVHEAVNATQLVSMLIEALCHVTAPWSPDLLVTDVRMPGGSGLDVVARIRRFDDRMPIVVISAFADDSVRAEAKRLGVAQVLEKPFELEELRRLAVRLMRAEPA